MTPREITQEDLTLLALGALEPHEEAVGLRSVEADPAAAEELETYRSALAEAWDLPEVEPPPAARAAILGQLGGRTASVGTGASRVEPGRSQAPGTAEAPESDPTRPRRVTRRGALLGGLVLAASAAGLLVLVDPLGDEPLSPEDQVLQAEDLRDRSADLSAGRLVVASSEEVGRSVVMAEDVEPAPSGRVYQAWLVHQDGSVSSAGVLQPRDGRMIALLPEDVGQAVGVALTEEPSGGSQQPTTEPMGSVDL